MFCITLSKSITEQFSNLKNLAQRAQKGTRNPFSRLKYLCELFNLFQSVLHACTLTWMPAIRETLFLSVYANGCKSHQCPTAAKAGAKLIKRRISTIKTRRLRIIESDKRLHVYERIPFFGAVFHCIWTKSWDALERNDQNKPALYVYNALCASIPRLRALLIDCFLATFNYRDAAFYFYLSSWNWIQM